jgi:drug/metabolite transporter (DMT)-like permease
MDIALALVAALLFALGTVLQQRAGLEEGTGGSSSGLLVRMARRPVWVAGIAADALGFVAQAAALTIGRLAVVQPLLVSAVVFALPLGAKLTGQRIRKLDVAAAVLVTVSLVLFLTIANPSGGRDDAPLGEWLLAGGVIGALCVPLVLLSRGMPPGRKAALLGTAAGLLFAFSAALTKAVTDRLDEGLIELVTDWRLYALIAVGYVSMTLNQLALSTGSLAPAAATSMALDPITSVVLGVTLLQESIHETTLGAVFTLLALAGALAGMVVLATGESGRPAPKPGPSTARGRPGSRGRLADLPKTS